MSITRDKLYVKQYKVVGGYIYNIYYITPTETSLMVKLHSRKQVKEYLKKKFE